MLPVSSPTRLLVVVVTAALVSTRAPERRLAPELWQ